MEMRGNYDTVSAVCASTDKKTDPMFMKKRARKSE